MYNVVGVVKNSFHVAQANLELREPERGQGRPAKRDVYRRPLTPRTARQDCHWTKRKLRPYSGFLCGSRPRLVSFESYGASYLHQPCIRSSTTDHDSFSELPVSLSREAGRSINKAIGFRLPQDLPGYPACELAARAALLHAASSTAAPPIFVRWQLSPPHCHGETSIADSPAAILDPAWRPSGPPRPASSASSGCLAC